jgi:5-methylcytosine-specific restriction endonuclease McrA
VNWQRDAYLVSRMYTVDRPRTAMVISRCILVNDDDVPDPENPKVSMQEFAGEAGIGERTVRKYVRIWDALVLEGAVCPRTAMAPGVDVQYPVEPTAPYDMEWLWERDGGRCWICGIYIPKKGPRTIDHVIPRAATTERCRRFGLPGNPGDTWANVALACADCNYNKLAKFGEREVATHLELLANYPPGYCTILRVQSGIAEPPEFYMEWEWCRTCNREKPARDKCPDCRARKLLSVSWKPGEPYVPSDWL